MKGDSETQVTTHNSSFFSVTFLSHANSELLMFGEGKGGNNNMETIMIRRLAEHFLLSGTSWPCLIWFMTVSLWWLYFSPIIRSLHQCQLLVLLLGSIGQQRQVKEGTEGGLLEGCFILQFGGCIMKGKAWQERGIRSHHVQSLEGEINSSTLKYFFQIHLFHFLRV